MKKKLRDELDNMALSLVDVDTPFGSKMERWDNTLLAVCHINAIKDVAKEIKRHNKLLEELIHEVASK